jgi:hypothetical protein
MMIRLQILLILLIFSCAALFGQERIEGSRFNNETYTLEKIFFSNSNRSANPHFYNRYVIFSTKVSKDTLYIIDLNFDKSTDSIEIKQVDKKRDTSASIRIKSQILPANLDTSKANLIYCVKNYTFFDTTLIQNETNLKMLFTIVANSNMFVMFLHQFRSVNGDFFYTLDKFRSSYKIQSDKHTAAYWAWYKKDSLEKQAQKRKTSKEVDAERKNIRSELDPMVLQLRMDTMKILSSQMEASTLLRNSFYKSVEKILIANLHETRPYNYTITGKYLLLAAVNKPNLLTEKPNFISDTSQNRFLSDKINTISSAITSLKLEHIKIQRKGHVDSLFAQLLLHHLSRCETNQLDPRFFDSYIDSISTIILAPFKKELETDTWYEYKINYSSETEWKIWSFRGDSLFCLDDRSTIVNESNIKSFHSKVPNAKFGKYNIRLNSAKLNDTLFGPDVFTAYRKYKYVTHFGISIGTLLNTGNSETSKETSQGKYVFFNLLFIRHHLGAFAGFSSAKGFSVGGTSKTYLEAGMYLAPWNYLYLKVGATLFNEQWNGLAGISLIVPCFQLEAGYNMGMHLPYITLGFNIPLNK